MILVVRCSCPDRLSPFEDSSGYFWVRWETWGYFSIITTTEGAMFRNPPLFFKFMTRTCLQWCCFYGSLWSTTENFGYLLSWACCCSVKLPPLRRYWLCPFQIFTVRYSSRLCTEFSSTYYSQSKPDTRHLILSCCA